MARIYADWLQAYCDHAGYSEAPRKMHFWTGVSVLAGALRRRSWINMGYFNWYPNFYIILVAPPGIVSKTTTVNIGMSLLRRVPGINFGPDIVTWQALVGAFEGAREDFPISDEKNILLQIFQPMSPLTLESGELGNLLDPQDRSMVDLLVTLWDGKDGSFEKKTKASGNNTVVNPWINIIACTTPAWIAGNFPEYLIGGGLTSRCIFVYAEEKEKFVAYPGRHIPNNFETQRDNLTMDLEYISTAFTGAFDLSEAAYQWGEVWYSQHYKSKPVGMSSDRFGGYIARKQTHIHKLALVLAASHSDSQVIEAEDLALANAMVTDLEKDIPRVFDKIGRSENAIHSDSILKWLAEQPGGQASFSTLYKKFFPYFPNGREFGEIFAGLVTSGQVQQLGIGVDSVVKLLNDNK